MANKLKKEKTVSTNNFAWAYYYVVEQLVLELLVNKKKSIKGDLFNFVKAYRNIDGDTTEPELFDILNIMQEIQDKYNIEVYFPRARLSGDRSRKCFTKD